MSTLQTYYFEKQDSGEWHVHDQHGTGDMILEQGDIHAYVLPNLVLWAANVLDDTKTYSQVVKLNTVGFDPILGMVLLHVKDGLIQRAELCGISRKTVINHSLTRFTLTLPYFVGKRIPDECD